MYLKNTAIKQENHTNDFTFYKGIKVISSQREIYPLEFTVHVFN